MTDEERLTRLEKTLFGINGTRGVDERVRDAEALLYGDDRTGRDGLVKRLDKIETRNRNVSYAILGGIVALLGLAGVAGALGAQAALSILDAVTAIQEAIP